MKKKNRGFTLIELLAVIIILGVLLLIAIPAVSKYIDNSRQSTYINLVKSLANAISNSVNALELPFVIGKNQGLIVPFSEIELENKSAKEKSPYAEWVEEKSYILVVFDGERYIYYVSALDKNDYAIPLVKEKELTTKSITTNKAIIDSTIISYQEIMNSNEKTKYNMGGLTVNYLDDKDNFVKLKIKSNELAEIILEDNTAYADNVRSPYVLSDTGIDFSQVASSRNGQGLYYTNKNTDGGKTTYYFRGNVDNNYVVFQEKVCIITGGDKPFGHNTVGEKIRGVETESECLGLTKVFANYPTWYYYNYSESEVQDRIAEGSGSMIEVETSWGYSTDEKWRIIRINEDGSVRATILDFGTSYETSYSLMANVDDVNYGNSSVKVDLDDWYEKNLLSYTSFFVDAGYCNDVTYGYVSRIGNPQFSCPNSNDVYKLGNGKLTYPVGLITSDEANYSDIQSWFNGAYLTKGNTMTMYDKNSSITLTDYSKFDVSGDAWNYSFPVINLKGDLKVIEGNGTVDDPYVVSEN